MTRWYSVKKIRSLSGWFGVVGLYVFSFTAWMSKDVAAFGLALIILSCLMDAKLIWKAVKNSPLLWVVVATGLYILFRTFFVSMVSEPEYFELHSKDGFRMFYLLGFVLIGWVMAADQKRILYVFAVAFAGFTIARLWDFDWSFSAPVSWWKLRTGLGLPAIAFGHYAAAALIGLFVFAPRIFRSFGSSVQQWAVGLLWLVLVLLALEGVVLSQSRFVWVSLILILPVIVYFSWSYIRYISKTYRVVLVVTAALIATSSMVLNWETIASRSMAEADTWQKVFSGRLDEVETSGASGAGKSIGTRIRMLEIGVSEWANNPFFGLGPAAPKIMLANSDIPRFSRFNDFHNGIVEILVRHGAVGLLMLLLCLAYTLQAGWRSYCDAKFSYDVYLFLMSGMLLLLLSMLTNFRMLNSDWRFYLFLFSGALVSFELCKNSIPALHRDNVP